MRNAVMFCALSSGLAHFLAGLCDAGAAEPPSDPDVARRLARKAAFLERAGEAMRSYRFTDPADPQAAFRLHEGPLQTWTNPAGGDWDGAVFLWTLGGRPAVIVSVYQGYHREGQPVTHEFQSLAAGPIVATRSGQEVWRPQTGGVTMRSVPAAPDPAATPQGRLVQMRAIARRFDVVMTDRDGIRRDLRLLPQPIYRYSDDEASTADGAVFTFAHGTDPEAVLLLEARREDGGHGWHYGFGRLNSAGMTASARGDVVWRGPLIDWVDTRDRESAYTCFFQQ
jgi:hypothetical protein